MRAHVDKVYLIIDQKPPSSMKELMMDTVTYWTAHASAFPTAERSQSHRGSAISAKPRVSGLPRLESNSSTSLSFKPGKLVSWAALYSGW